MKNLLWLLVSVFLVGGGSALAQEFPQSLKPFFAQHCNDCHSNGVAEGGLDLTKLGENLSDAETFERWERIYDRVEKREMPPKDADQPNVQQRERFTQSLHNSLSAAHAKTKSTTLRRLNRQEYENTLNDLFGTNLKLKNMLPEDGRSHEFDNVGESLGISLVHLQQYMEAVRLVLDTAIANQTEPPKSSRIETSYKNTREAERFVGTQWKELKDGAIVQFQGGGYPSGMLRTSRVREAGRYRIRITGYAYQSDNPIVFSVGGTTFERGAEKPTFGFFSFPPGKPGQNHTVELEAWIEGNYMLQIEPHGISDPDRYKRESIDEYKGPGLAIVQATLEGPLVKEFPSRGHRLVFEGLNRSEIMPRNPRDRQKRFYVPKFQIESKDEARDASQALTRVAAAAYRRSVSAEDVAPYVSLFTRERNAGSSFEEALRTAVIALFCSPKFLYLQENPGQLDDDALAARLSYFFTRTLPDAELQQLAEDDRLTNSDTLRQQTERLLNDPRFDRFLTDFTDSWLDLRQMEFTLPDRSLYPEYDTYLHHSMPAETRAFLNELIKSNLPVTNLVKSDFAMLNSRLAEHYGLPSVHGTKPVKVALPKDSLRGGLLSQAAILKVTANGTNTSPVTRGAWVMERILGETPTPPPPGIPGVEPDIRGAKTLRELLDKHRDVVSCQACHQKIDPPGFALESFNPIGGYRERYRSLGEGERISLQVNGRNVRYKLGPAVDSSGHFYNGPKFQNYVQFRDHLAQNPELLTRTLTKKLLMFATGREMGFSDRDEIERIVKAAGAKGYGVRDIVHLVVQSDIFRHK